MLPRYSTAPNEINETMLEIAGRARVDKASTCLDKPVYRRGILAYYKNTYEREKSLTYTIIPIIMAEKLVQIEVRRRSFVGIKI